ncbi:CopG family transcriptional regulator [Limimaricola litoreus]|uniref:CopG family transcriptional regulator n=1 Tax=Limimaricola litoreus TaxID=2955316 RepID=A0A9X2JRP5_9RHOB|nr:CopG family transcriptional regulator [Limimaricola litoreus]MCP1168916.1 CopG family transcriptional regulator [Limimaricola litoreus]
MAKSFSLSGLVDTEAKTPNQKGQEGARTRSKPKAAPKPKPAPAPMTPSKRLSLVLDGETYQALRRLSFETSRTHQDILDEAARAYLRKHASTQDSGG